MSFLHPYSANGRVPFVAAPAAEHIAQPRRQKRIGFMNEGQVPVMIKMEQRDIPQVPVIGPKRRKITHCAMQSCRTQEGSHVIWRRSPFDPRGMICNQCFATYVFKVKLID